MCFAYTRFVTIPQSILEQLKIFTVIAADTGDFESIKKFKTTNATTNPSLILKAVEQPKYRYLLEESRGELRRKSLNEAMDHLIVSFGIEILKIVKERVSTEVDARLSFDIDGTVRKAKSIIRLYEESGIQRDKVLIKIASTWEGICAAKILETEGIFCNLTLLFSKTQAIACADAGVTLISPFVGRVLDWYKLKPNFDYSSDNDPGVRLVTEVFNYYKHFNYKTVIMGASFRNVQQIISLAGCDLLTISPALLEELSLSLKKIDRKLSPKDCEKLSINKISYDEKTFRYELNDDSMATEKLAEGIRLFSVDIEKLEKLLRA